MSTIKKIEIKVTINCKKCKKDVLKAVTKLCGINQVSVDAEKGLLIVIGDVDPVMVVKQVRKAGKCAELVSVGPPKPPTKPPKTESPKKCPALPPCCKDCQQGGVNQLVSFQDVSVCNIL